MRLPWALPDPPTLKQGGELADLPWPYAAGRNVLVIEEHPPYREHLEALLRRAGYGVLVATDAAEGLRRARDERPDVIVMDRRLPGLHRFRVLNQLGEDPTTASIPTILVDLSRRDPSWRLGDENVGYVSGDSASLLDVLRRLDLAAWHRAEAAANFQPDSSQQRPDVAPSQPGPPRILAADAERHVVRFMEACLREAGYQVTTCPDDRELLARARMERPDAIVMDMLILATHSWLKVFSTLKADPTTARIPFVLLSGHHPGIFSSLWIPPSGSAAQFLVKPFSAAELLAAVATALGRNPAER